MEPPGMDNGETEGAGHSRLIESKMMAPQVMVSVLRRPRVEARLDEAFSASVMLVCAPAGYGKTVAVSSWLRARGLPVAWTTVDEGDNDPVRLWTYVAESVNRLCERTGDEALGLLRQRGAAVKPAVDALIAALSADGRSVVLVLDDLHLVTDESCLHSLDHAVRTLPANVCLIALSRTGLPRRWKRSLSQGELVVIDGGALAFSQEEGREMLIDIERLPLRPDQVTTLVQQTEGWAAALRLATLWLGGEDDPGVAVAQFGGAHRLVVDYLVEQVLDRLDPEISQFLIGTSTLPRLCSDLCDHVLDVTGSAASLRRIERSNLFLIALDDRRTWFRYHALFRQALQAKLGEWPNRVRADIARRAGDWFDSHGLIEEAVEQAVLVRDHERVAAMVDEHHLRLIREGRAVTLAKWIESLPDETLVARPRLLVAQLLSSLGPSDYVVERRRLVARAREAHRRHREGWTPYDEVQLELVASQSYDDDVGAALESGQKALDLAREHVAELLVAALGGYSFIAFLAGQDAEAERSAEEAVEQPEAARRTFGHVTAAATLSLVAAQRVDAPRARALADTAVAAARAAGILTTGTGARVRMAEATVAVMEGRLGDAQHAIEQALRITRADSTAIRAWMLVKLADVCGRQGDLRRAHSLLLRAEALVHECRDAGRVPAIAHDVKRRLNGALTSTS